MARLLPLLFLGLFLTGCSHKAELKGPAKHYHLSGTVVSINERDQSASIDAAAIPDYMEAMKMDYPVAQKSDLQKMHPGDHIEAALDVYESGDYTISRIDKIQSHSGK
jgi:Cu/Ag efflux protein CusF